jgi:hypothetical protein
MTPESFIATGQRLYGRKKWKSQLAAAFQVDVSTIHRMTHRPLIPGPWVVALNALLAQKKARDELERAAMRLLPRKLRRKKLKPGERRLIPYAGKEAE